jgi:hypothetical protein
MYNLKNQAIHSWTKLLMRKWLVTATLTVVVICLFAIIPCTAFAQDFAVTLYGGRVTQDIWSKSLTPGVEFTDTYIIVGALTWTAKRFFDGALSLELEGQIGKYFGDQDNWEFNLPIVTGRWNLFPWNHIVSTSFAFGIGPSYATRVPPLEEVLNDSSQQWLIYWFSELTFGPPKKNWSVALRLHHRSSGFGFVAEHGGLNILAAGIKFRW